MNMELELKPIDSFIHLYEITVVFDAYLYEKENPEKKVLVTFHYTKDLIYEKKYKIENLMVDEDDDKENIKFVKENLIVIKKLIKEKIENSNIGDVFDEVFVKRNDKLFIQKDSKLYIKNKIGEKNIYLIRKEMKNCELEFMYVYGTEKITSVSLHVPFEKENINLYLGGSYNQKEYELLVEQIKSNNKLRLKFLLNK